MGETKMWAYRWPLSSSISHSERSVECDIRFGARIRLSTAGFTDETAQIWIDNRRRIEEKQGEEEAEVAVESAGVMRDRMHRKMRKIKNLKFARNLTKFGEI